MFLSIPFAVAIWPLQGEGHGGGDEENASGDEDDIGPDESASQFGGAVGSKKRNASASVPFGPRPGAPNPKAKSDVMDLAFGPRPSKGKRRRTGAAQAAAQDPDKLDDHAKFLLAKEKLVVSINQQIAKFTGAKCNYVRADKFMKKHQGNPDMPANAKTDGSSIAI